MTAERFDPKIIDGHCPGAAVVRKLGSAAVLWQTAATSVMNRRSSQRLAIAAAIVGTAAVKPFESADSDSPVCRDNAERTSRETLSRKASRIDAIKTCQGVQ